jgi:hypothetical protein
MFCQQKNAVQRIYQINLDSSNFILIDDRGILFVKMTPSPTHSHKWKIVTIHIII